MGELLKHVEQKAPLHPALKDAFSRLYGYTSDEGGIRHALMDDSRAVTFEEAKFMLVACSAFINYVRRRHQVLDSHLEQLRLAGWSQRRVIYFSVCSDAS